MALRSDVKIKDYLERRIEVAKRSHAEAIEALSGDKAFSSYDGGRQVEDVLDSVARVVIASQMLDAVTWEERENGADEAGQRLAAIEVVGQIARSSRAQSSGGSHGFRAVEEVRRDQAFRMLDMLTSKYEAEWRHS